eukprot:gnl/TRDRNA2_/TRDRNA2_175590_c1_seq6.p1 gnl/TRDRNA2_/TRDRNA2_175590_c1~~gnl/TRDRNA2_/TRDRNA2_175590_c1_seq6.p1  ORF type:complete len:306 (+),score=34.07 gnl/TRDRNA2_/TRDRNA2_175590_c1_seq6:24-920(+)
MLALLFGLICVSSFVSSITDTLARLRSLKAQQAAQYWLLRRYLREQGVSHGLSTRIFRYITVVIWAQQRHTQQKDVELIDALSKPLKAALQTELCESAITKHKLFKYLKVHGSVVQALCSSGIKEVIVSLEDMIFNAGVHATDMYFLKRGAANYFFRGECRSLYSGSWFSEAVLWTPWIHRGDMKCVLDCNLTALDSTTFREVMKKHTSVLNMPRRYAHAFLEVLMADILDTDGCGDLQSSLLASPKVTAVFGDEDDGEIALQSYAVLDALQDPMKWGGHFWKAVSKLTPRCFKHSQC